MSATKQFKSHEPKRQGESAIDKQINKSQPKQILNHCDSYSLDSRVLAYFVVFATLKLHRNDESRKIQTLSKYPKKYYIISNIILNTIRHC